MNPLDLGEDSKPATFELRAQDDLLFEQLAALRNALSDVQGRRTRKRWSRKSIGESGLAAFADQVREQLAPTIAAVGPLPDPEDAEACEKYARRVLAWEKRQG